MRRLTFIVCLLGALFVPAGIALGACRTGDGVERALERGHLVTLLDKAGNPAGCAVLVADGATAARRYDASTGRFTATDPLEWPVGLPKMNAYQYAFNNPMAYTDPSGAWPGQGAASWVLDHTVESDAAYAYSNWVWNHDTVNSVFETVNKVNPAVGFLNNADQCANGDWGPNGKPRTDAGMVAAGYEYGVSGDGNHCWKAGAYGALTALTATGLQAGGAALLGGGGGAALTAESAIPQGYRLTGFANSGKGLVYQLEGSSSTANTIRIMQGSGGTYVRVTNGGGAYLDAAGNVVGKNAASGHLTVEQFHQLMGLL